MKPFAIISDSHELTHSPSNDSGVRPQTVDRGNACEGLRKESWKKNPGRGILEDDPWNRNHGEEKPWRRGPGGGILEEASWKRNP